MSHIGEFAFAITGNLRCQDPTCNYKPAQGDRTMAGEGANPLTICCSNLCLWIVSCFQSNLKGWSTHYVISQSIASQLLMNSHSDTHWPRCWSLISRSILAQPGTRTPKSTQLPGKWPWTSSSPTFAFARETEASAAGGGRDRERKGQGAGAWGMLHIPKPCIGSQVLIYIPFWKPSCEQSLFESCSAEEGFP